MPIAGRASGCESGGTGRGGWVELRMRRLPTAHLALTGSQPARAASKAPKGKWMQLMAGWCG